MHYATKCAHILSATFSLSLCIPTGMNAAVVLIILLLAVPLQLFLSNYIQQVYLESTSSDLTAAGKGASGRKGVESDGQTMVVDRGGKKADNLDAIRADAMNRLDV